MIAGNGGGGRIKGRGATANVDGRFAVTTVEAVHDGWEADDPGWPELDLTSVPDLYGAENDGLPLGKLVDIPLKWFLCAADIADDPLGGITNRAFLRSANDSHQRLKAAVGIAPAWVVAGISSVGVVSFLPG